MRCILLGLFIACPCWAQDVVRVATGYVLPPYVIQETQSGLEVDIVRAALAASQLKMKIEFYPPARALLMLKSDKVDALTTVNEGVGAAGFWSDSHISYQNYAISLQNRHLNIRKISDLNHYSIAAFQNAKLSLGSEFANVAQQAVYQEYPDQLTQNKLLYTGRVEVVIGDKFIFEYLNTKLGKQVDLQQAVQFDAIFPPTQYKVLFRNAELRDQFNRGLTQIRRNGEYQKILNRYLKPPH